jgi:ABC-2 type transport system ATP-binding protein
MVVVKELVKNYAGIKALRGLSFQVDKGEIVGLLGPNGAGKSTTMRIITAYLPPTSGEVSVSGLCVVRDSLEVRRRIGYMPEQVPLYREMRVEEFLSFRARLKGVSPRRLRARLDHVISLCQIGDVSRRIIGTLSKGYQQRVGLADAVVHDPDLLILDEPTIGLDPAQVRQFRETIRGLRPRHTVILSSHILSEVEAVCSRVLILRKGKIEASDTPENLKKAAASGSTVYLEARAPAQELAAALRSLRSVEDVEVTTLEDGWVKAVVMEERGADLREVIGCLLLDKNWLPREMHRKQASLEDVFVEITHEDRT